MSSQITPSQHLREMSGHVVLERIGLWSTWVAQLVKRLVLDLGSGHDLTVCEFEPRVGL